MDGMDLRLSLLEKITNGFSEDNYVGSGAYGAVYKGMHNGKEIAVKKLHPLVGLDDKDFDNEFRNLSKVQHENIVQLIGYCYESRINYVEHNGQLNQAMIKERILCFDYMQGGSLDKHITDESCDLEWPVCYKIITGTCVGLNHLHSARDQPILHMDLKPSNILLDNNKTAKIADLGLSKLVNSSQTHKTQRCNIRGTFGYMPPEYIKDCALSPKFDIFSLGAIIIRILDGNHGQSRFAEVGAEQFIKNVIRNWERRLQGTSRDASNGRDIRQVKRCAEIAIRCVDAERKNRPYIKNILQELEELEAEIKKMSQYSDNYSTCLVDQTRSSSCTLLSFDPSQELRFLFEPRINVSSCLQLTNLTDGYIAFSIKTNTRKYYAQPNTGVMQPCSKRYICVTLRSQEEAPQNMQCHHDMFVVQSARVSEDFKFTADEITDDSLKEGKVVHNMTLPIVYVAKDQFPSSDV